jgi:hypothetical protein
MTTEPDFFVKQGDFQFLAAGRPMMFYREPAKALADWKRGWRGFFEQNFPAQVAAIDAALGFTPEADQADEPNQPDEPEAEEPDAG